MREGERNGGRAIHIIICLIVYIHIDSTDKTNKELLVQRVPVSTLLLQPSILQDEDSTRQ